MVNKDKWAEIYNPGNDFKVNPYDYDNVDALREEWKEKYDPFSEHNTDVEDYDSLEEYQEAIED